MRNDWKISPRLRVGAWLFFALVVEAATGFNASMPYLAVVGPPPLRIWQDSRYIFEYTKFEADLAARAMLATNQAPASAGTNANPYKVSAPRQSNDDSTPIIVRPPPPPVVPSSGDLHLSASSDIPSTPIKFDMPDTSASDLLTVTPQMIAQYLSPGPNGANTNTVGQPGAVVFVPAGMPYAPPTTPSVNPGPQSRANYRVQ